MAFNGSEGSPINEEIAGSWTLNYRNNFKEGTKAHFFGRDILLQLLKEPGAMGIRFYYGIDTEGNRQLLAVAADAAQNDLLGSSGKVADDSAPCPPYGSIANVLNS